MKSFFGLFTLILFKRIRENRLIKAKTHKRCNGCTEVKPLDGFNKQKDCKLGRASKCKVCKNAYMKKRRATPEGKATSKKANDKLKADPVRYAARKKKNREWNSKKRETPEGLLKFRCVTRICNAKSDLGFTWGPLGEEQPRGPKGGPDSTFNLLGIVSWEKYVKYIKKRFYGGMSLSLIHI